MPCGAGRAVSGLLIMRGSCATERFEDWPTVVHNTVVHNCCREGHGRQQLIIHLIDGLDFFVFWFVFRLCVRGVSGTAACKLMLNRRCLESGPAPRPAGASTGDKQAPRWARRCSAGRPTAGFCMHACMHITLLALKQQGVYATMRVACAPCCACCEIVTND